MFNPFGGGRGRSDQRPLGCYILCAKVCNHGHGHMREHVHMCMCMGMSVRKGV